MDICEKIATFENHVFTRQLRVAKVLGERFCANVPSDPLAESAFAIISICFSYFEMIQQFSVGQSSHHQSQIFFKAGFEQVFPNLSIAASDVAHLYSMMRCGMYHTAMPTDRCGLSRDLTVPIAKVDGMIVINPARLVDHLIAHVQQYCSDLRDGFHCNLRHTFETMFDSLSLQAKTLVQPTASVTAQPW